MKTIVIYHKADFDGIFCREIARKFLPEAELIGWDYGDPTPPVEHGDKLYILDLSVPNLMNHPNLVWIDHHKSAIEKYGNLIVGYRIDGVAACRLAWQWFEWQVAGHDPHFNQLDPALPTREEYVNRTVHEPWSIRLVGEYDIWDKRDPDAELFQHGLRSRDLNNDWNFLLQYDRKATEQEVESLTDIGHGSLIRPDGTSPNPTVLGLLDAGKALQYAKTHENESIIKAFGFTIQFEGFTLLACNAARYNSQLFSAGLKPEHDGCLGFNWDGQKNEWRVSLYTDKPGVDLSPVAVKYGGGGHRGACGFRIGKLPFLP